MEFSLTECQTGSSRSLRNCQRPREALRGNRAWADLKQFANRAHLRLIQGDELDHQIRNRQASGFSGSPGKKYMKSKANGPQRNFESPSSQHLSLSAEDIMVPTGVFKEVPSTSLRQLQIKDIGPNISGVIVVNLQDATMLMKQTRPISARGLALLIVDDHTGVCEGQGELVRFPATYIKTSEPIILSARLVQLGNILVARQLPEQLLQVDQIEIATIRILVYRDESDINWDVFQTSPAKQLLKHYEFIAAADAANDILDIWDRQWPTLNWIRAKPPQASIFAMTMRVREDLVQKPRHRLASWGAVIGSYEYLSLDPPSKTHFDSAVECSCHFWPLAQGMVPGLHQTVLRGEIWGGITAFEWGTFTQRPIRFWCDNQQVCRFVSKALQGSFRPCADIPDHDLWLRLWEACQPALHSDSQVIKIVAQTEPDLLPVADWFGYWGNDTAHHLANSACRTMPNELADLWQKHQEADHFRLRLRTSVHETILAVSAKAILAKQQTQPSLKEGPVYDRAATEAFVAPIPDHFGDDQAGSIARWVRTMITCDGAPRWISLVELLRSLQMVTPISGVHFDKGLQMASPSMDTHQKRPMVVECGGPQMGVLLEIFGTPSELSLLDHHWPKY